MPPSIGQVLLNYDPEALVAIQTVTPTDYLRPLYCGYRLPHVPTRAESGFGIQLIE